ncbi:MAG: transporter substrate-binding domain-containing protein [Archangium sp.]|nr:transporter substrate-binding domain-containing protein [Archangium sp.]
MHFAIAALALVATAADEPRVLRVGVAGAVPFVSESKEPEGLSVDVFNAIAENGGYRAQFEPVSTVDEALRRVEKGELDIAVGPLSVTAERLERVSFTQPYFHAGLSALSPVSSQRFSPFVSRAFLFGVVVLLIVLVAVGTVVWLMERRANPQQFPPDAKRGIGAGMWLAVVTMTTVGYGDKAPVTTRGRFVTGVWMLISMMFASSLTAGIATTLTLSQMGQVGIERPTELRGRRVSTVSGSTSVEFARRYGASVFPQATLSEAVQRMEKGETDAVIFDRPMLQNYLREHPETHAQLSEAEWEPHGYAFAVAIDSDLLHPFNIALVQTMEDGRMGPISARWLGASR